MKKIRPSRGESRRRATKLGRNAASNSKYPIHFCLECFIRCTVPQDLSRKTVGPQLHTLMRGVLFADMQNYDIPKLHITSGKKTLYVAGAFYIIEQVPLTEIHGF